MKKETVIGIIIFLLSLLWSYVAVSKLMDLDMFIAKMYRQLFPDRMVSVGLCLANGAQR